MIGVVLGTGWKHVQLPLGVKGIGRPHLYEGFSAAESVLHIRAAIAGGCDTILLTNACGAVNLDLELGEILTISDHINLTGESLPLGFLPLPNIYTTVGDFRHGVYAQVRGPLFETPAEARYLRTIGADVVGMSTALEAVQAYHDGCRVVGLSLITDYAGGASRHEDVLKVAEAAPLQAVIDKVLEELDGTP